MKSVLGIDIGTQSLKSVIYNYETRHVESVTSCPLDVDRDGSGKAEQQAVWWTDALRDALAAAPAAARESICAIGVSGQQHGFVPIDAKGNVLAPVKLWCDTATQGETDEINAAAGGAARAIELCGNRVMTGYTAPKVRWLKKNNPSAYGKLAHILLPHDYINYVLTGTLCMEHGDASGTGLLDVRARTWSEPMLRAVDADRDLSECLPRLVDAHEIIGRTTEEAARRFGLAAGIPVSAGGGDNMMGAIGTGNVRAGRMTMSLGTSGTLYAYSDNPVVDPTGNIAAFCSSTGGWLPLLCTLNCTIATELMRELFDVGLDSFDTLIGSVAPGSDGLTALPYFQGERTPDLPFARASLLGLSAGNCSKGHILRATVEGATYGLKLGIETLADLGLNGSEIVLTGGGANSRVWRQIIADTCNLPVTMLQQTEGAAFGAALQALWALQRHDDPRVSISDITDAHLSPAPAKSTTADPERVQIHERAYRAYKEAIGHVTPFYQNHRDHRGTAA